jgi:hypothetical protein
MQVLDQQTSKIYRNKHRIKIICNVILTNERANSVFQQLNEGRAKYKEYSPCR